VTVFVKRDREIRTGTNNSQCGKSRTKDEKKFNHKERKDHKKKETEICAIRSWEGIERNEAFSSLLLLARIIHTTR